MTNPASPRHALDPAPDFTPLPALKRLALEWDGARFAEIDPASGTVLTVGTAEEPRP
jgi:hypothetical protein